MRRSAEETREHVLQVAHELFYWQGIRATGVDQVAAEAAVAPTTLYRLFASKDDLVAAYVEHADQLYRQWFDAAAAAGGAGPRDQILAVFDALAEQVRPERCRGCPFLMTLAEFPDATHAAHRHAVAMKSWVRQRLGELTDQLARIRTGDPAELADHLTLIMEGVYASTQALGDHGPARRARALIERLLPPAASTHPVVPSPA
ncbi:MAG: TetR/AcrR family transcriptional regulator [Pseudonocardiaceae bacterium]